MRIHTFDNTSDAYDATQTDELISDGDVIVVPPENVVGFLLEAWPVSVTQERGAFHRLDQNNALVMLENAHVESCLTAQDVARVVGFKVDPLNMYRRA